MLAAVAAAITAVPTTQAPWSVRAAVDMISGLQRRTGPRPLDLLEDMYDEETGLCSEGVWHNSWHGIGCVLAARRLRAGDDAADAAKADELVASALKLSESLHDVSFQEGRGYAQRTSTGIWQATGDTIADAGEDPAFYEASDELRCVSNAAACLLHTFLVEELSGDAAVASRCEAAADAFASTFFDTSICRFRRAAGASEEAAAEEALPDGPPLTGPYFRAADQAMGALVCLRLARIGHRTAASRAMAACGADSLLREFGYSLYATEGQPGGTYLGRPRPRNAWHDALACFALISTNCLGVGGESPQGLCNAMAADYATPNGLLSHEPRELSSEGPRVHFTSTQAVWSAVLRAAELPGDGATLGGVDFDAGLRAFHEERADADGLMPVADVYPEVRLWANTEFAAWVLLERSDFLDGAAAGGTD